jgi:transcriptional regulator with XRE-family HTH domain
MAPNEQQLYRHIGAQLRQRRTALGLSQAELAQQVGLLRTSITNIEAGRQRLPIHVLYQLCDVLRLEVHAVLPDMAGAGRVQTVPVTVGATTAEVPLKTAEFLRQVLDEAGAQDD